MWPLTVPTLLTPHPLVFVPLSPFVLYSVFSCSPLHPLLSTLSFLPSSFCLSVLSFLCFKPLSIYSSSGLISLSLATYLLSLLLTSTFLSPPTHPSTFTRSHSDVTKVLTYLAQASHDLVPPDVSRLVYQLQHRIVACISRMYTVCVTVWVMWHHIYEYEVMWVMWAWRVMWRHMSMKSHVTSHEHEESCDITWAWRVLYM